MLCPYQAFAHCKYLQHTSTLMDKFRFRSARALQVLALLLMSQSSHSAEATTQLPDPFALQNGARVSTPAQWRAHRDDIKAQLARYEYGELPPIPLNVRVIARTITADGEHLRLSCGPNSALTFALEVKFPRNRTGPFPVLITGDALFKADEEATAPAVAQVLARGYALAQFSRADFAPDDATHNAGIYALYPDTRCGVLGAWAWGYGRVVDYLVTRPDIQVDHIAIVGHSRGGKAALLAGALDKRIALTAGAQSGTGGASPYRIMGKGSESLEKATARFGYWFAPDFQKFAGRENELPFDQHFLLALVAPRSLLLLNSLADPYTNAPAAHQSFLAAREVFTFLNASTLHRQFHARRRTFLRAPDDCRVLLDFADRQFFSQPSNTDFSASIFAAENTQLFLARTLNFCYFKHELKIFSQKLAKYV